MFIATFLIWITAFSMTVLTLGLVGLLIFKIMEMFKDEENIDNK